MAGLFKGLVPRTIHTFPVLFTLAAASYGGQNQDILEGMRMNPLLGSFKL